MNRDAFDARVDEQLRAAGADHVALAGYMRILSDDFVGRWAGRMINIHPSLLPLYKGLDTHQRAIDAELAVTAIEVWDAIGAIALHDDLRPGRVSFGLSAPSRAAPAWSARTC